jgi:formylglycine-generating enzyme required for sulfatase activity
VLDVPFALKEYLPADLARRTGDRGVEPLGPDAEPRFRSGLQHFLSEGRTVARLDHPNVVRVVRCFEGNGTAYLLMPYLRGESLPELLARGGTLSEQEALALARPLLDALAYLHDQSVVHRDVKPANIYVTEDGQPILLDFGAVSRDALGSEGYAAPEQFGGNAEVGPWTDAYGLAATLYRCVSGQVPVSARERQEAAAAGRPDPLAPLATLLEQRQYPAILPAIERGLVLDPAGRPRSIAAWRPAFGSPTAGLEPEGREWLPMILLALFALLLAAAVLWLLLGDRSDPSDPATSRPEAAEPIGRPGDPGESARWQAALEADTALAYRLFMEDYPESIHNDQARLHLGRLDDQAWEQAAADGSRQAIEAYREQFPQGRHETDALIALESLRLAEEAEAREQRERERADDAAWAEASTARSLDAVDQYLRDWPGGRHADEARSLRSTLQSLQDDQRAFEAAQKVGTIAGYQAYIDAFPRGARVADALEAIDGLTLRPGKTFRDCEGCPLLTVVPAGSFWQGSEDGAPGVLRSETPRRMVTLADSFAIGVHEVTFEQWDMCVEDGGCSHQPPDNGWGRGERPVIMVSWNDAVAYTDWLSRKTGQSYSLPSESQWEYAARAGEEGDWLGGNAAALCDFANVAGAESGLRWQHGQCEDPAALETLPAGSLKPNAFGLFDVIGNVAEWTLDCMNLSYLDAPVDGSAWGRGICSSHMTRGGSWFTGSKDVRLPSRFNLKNGDRNDFTGFRVVRKVQM